MNPIQTNKPVFFGDDGEVLKSGLIYIGQPNQWPIDFPKTVTFQDSAGSQFTAQQPLRTNSQGRIEFNGKAMIALVDGNYSMLVHDRNGVTVADGYTPFVENTDGGGATTEGVTQVGLLLSDIKQLNVTPGETVRNVGKSTTLDKLGADWLVVSNTGNPADDVDLIDFDNGTQGQRINNQTYRKDIVQSGLFMLDDPVNIINSTDADAYRNVWTSVDISSAVPDEATAANIRVQLRAAYPNNTTADNIAAFVYVRKTGSSAGANDAAGTRIASGETETNANEIISVNITGETVVPLDFGVSSTFEIYIVVNDPTSSAMNTDPDLAIAVTGYTINAKDLV